MALSNEFEPLDATQHDIKKFRCGKPTMDEFLHRYAAKNAKLGLSKTWVLADRQPETDKAAIAAYYTLSLLSIAPDQQQRFTALSRAHHLAGAISRCQQLSRQGFGHRILAGGIDAGGQNQR